MSKTLDNAKKRFHKMIDDFGSDPYGLISHLHEMEKWGRFVLKKHPEANEEIVFLAIWLHDVGHYPIPTDIDHAIRGEKIAKEFLESENLEKEKIAKVLHCIRAHRCKDVIPQTIEAKIIACIDSASHMTDHLYISMAKEGKFSDALNKLDRDYRDLSPFPEIKDKLTNTYNSWKELLKSFEQINISSFKK